MGQLVLIIVRAGTDRYQILCDGPILMMFMKDKCVKQSYYEWFVKRRANSSQVVVLRLQMKAVVESSTAVLS